MSGFEFRTPGAVISGSGAVRRIAEDHALRSSQRVLLVTDRTLVDLGLAGRVEEALRNGGAEVVTFFEVDGGHEIRARRRLASAEVGQIHVVHAGSLSLNKFLPLYNDSASIVRAGRDPKELTG